MAMPRKQPITNLYVSTEDINRLAAGKCVHKRANKHAHSIIPKTNSAIADKLQRSIAAQMKKLARIEGKPVKELVGQIKAKQKYTKRNAEYWSNYKGNNPNFGKQNKAPAVHQQEHHGAHI